MDKKALIEVQKFRMELKKNFSLDVLIFFGSRSTEKYTEDSDIDLLIVSSKFQGLSFFKRVAKMYDYWDSDYPVDFLCYTPEEYEELKNRAFQKQVIEEGIVIEG